MSSVKLSSKYQVVIPRSLRKELNLKPGQRMNIVKTKSGDITIKTSSAIDELQTMFAGRKIWGNDSVATIRKDRDEWEEHQKELDSLWHK